MWPGEYWKILIDSLTCRGSRNDPRIKYKDLADVLRPLIEERDGRFFPVSGTAIDQMDDSAIGMIEICRVEQGFESINSGCASGDQWPTDRWRQFRCPYFGTIGGRTSEAQTRENRNRLAGETTNYLQGRSSKELGLSFQLSAERRPRDLDNLVDAFMPFFNKHRKSIDRICATKEKPLAVGFELLRYTIDHMPTTLL